MRFKIDDVFLEKADLCGRDKMTAALLKKHPSIFSTTVANSILSQPIDAIYVGDGEKYITIVAAHHALESMTANIAFLLADFLMSNREFGVIRGINCKWLLSKYRFVILPCVNPDGVEMRYHGASNSPLRERQVRMSGGNFSSWQANARGVDLNHNYDLGFTEYKTIEKEKGIVPGATLYSGEYPESEPETKGVASLVRTLSPVSVVSLHTQGEEIFAFPDTAVMRRRGAKIATACGYTLSTPRGTASYGGLCDYTGSLGIPSFTFELGRGMNPLPESDVPGIFARVAEVLATIPSLI